MDHELGRRIADDVLKFGDREAGVQWQEDRADPSARELHLKRIRRVQGEHRNPVAAFDLAVVAQVRGEARDAGVELRVGELTFAGEVDNRRLGRRPAAEMGDPVIVANRHDLLRTRERSCAPPDLVDLTPLCCTRAAVSRYSLASTGWAVA